SPINNGIGRGGSTHYVTIQNTEIRHMPVPTDLASGACGICASKDEHHNLTRQNAIHHLASANTDASAHVHAIQIAGHTNVYEYNECALNASHCIYMFNGDVGSAASHNIIRHNVIHDNGSRGLLIGSGDNNTAYNNLVYRNGVGDQKEAIRVHGFGHF